MATQTTETDEDLSATDSLRDTLDAAFEQHATDETQEAKTTAAPAEATALAEDPGNGERVRDASGRFAPKAGEAPAQAPTGPAITGLQQPGTGTPAPPPGELKPPASWTPQAREKWAGLDPEIRAEVHRREGEAQRVLQQGAQARQFIEAFESVVRPYEVFIRSENSNPLQAVQNLMSTAAEFRVGTPARKVELVTGIIKNFGIDIEALDAALAGVLPQGGQQQHQQQFRDPRVDQLLAQQQQSEQQRQQLERAAVEKEMQTFAASHEFYRDVEATMADILELRARRGEVIDLEKAYQQACNLHEGVSTILAQRTSANPARGTQQNSQAVLRAKRAASSVKGDSNPATGAHVPKDDSIRASIEAAFDSISDA